MNERKHEEKKNKTKQQRTPRLTDEKTKQQRRPHLTDMLNETTAQLTYKTLPTLLGANQRQIPASRQQARRRGGKPTRDWLTTEDLRICSLNATRDHPVPAANLC